MGVVQMHQNVKIGWMPSMALSSSPKTQKRRWKTKKRGFYY